MKATGFEGLLLSLSLGLHLSETNLTVPPTSSNDGADAQKVHIGNHIVEEDDTEEGLNGGLYSTRNGVGERASVLNLHENGNVDEPSSDTGSEDAHPGVKVVGKNDERIEDGDFASEDEEGEKEDDGHGGVIDEQTPLVALDGGQNFLHINSIKSDENGRQHAKEESKPVEFSLTLRANNESKEDDHDCAHAKLGNRLAQNDSLKQARPEHGQRSRYLVEGYLDELKAEVVENDHGEVHNRQGSDGFGNLHVELHFGKHRQCRDSSSSIGIIEHKDNRLLAFKERWKMNQS